MCKNHTVPNPTNSLCTAVNVSASGGLRTLRPPIDPHFTSPLLQNPGGATGACCGAVSVCCRCSVYKSSGSVEATVLCSVKSEASHISGRSRALCSSPAPSSPPSVTTSLLDKHGRPHTADPPGKMNEKFKSESMQKKSNFLCLCYILKAIRAGRCRERRYADHTYSDILQNAPFRSQIFKIFFAFGGKGALTP